MGEEDQEITVNGKCPGKLINLNAPLLSTRRTNICMDRLEMPNAANSLGVSWDSCERIPFSWEQTPGKPKNFIETSAATETGNDYLLPPRPPPGRWHLIKTEAAAACWEYCNGSNNVVVDDDGCDGDVDDDDDDDDGVSSTNALDIFSLAESVETNETGDRARSTLSSMKEEKERDLEKEGAIMNNMVSPSTNFMLQRFLPDAKALAAASSSSAFAIINHDNNNQLHHDNILRSNNYGCTNTSTSRAVSLRQSSPFFSSKGGCGLDIFLPWRVKPKSRCGMKSDSPVMALPTSKLPWSREKYK